MSDDDISDETSEQDVPVGGAVDGKLANAAVATLPQGILTVREMPALAATFGKLTLPPLSTSRIGRHPQRRRLLLSVRSADPDAFVTLAESEYQASIGYGLDITPGHPPIPLHYAGELWVCAFGASPVTVSFVAEIDHEIRAHG
jgi:hypothetical protein